jgi:CO/xanthine dehydrogenase Mo-binding subunit
MVYAIPVCSTVAKGKLTRLDTSDAEKMPGAGHPINNNLADYCMAVNADTPEIDVTFLDYPDLVMNEYGARGVGEIGLAGVAAAIRSAVYHFSGVRIRRLPVKIEDLLEGGGGTVTLPFRSKPGLLTGRILD